MFTKYQPTSGGTHVTMDISTPTAIKGGWGHINRVFVNTTPTASGGIYNVATTGAIAPANLVCSIPAGTIGPIVLDVPMDTGIVIDPGTSGVVSVSWT